MHKGTIKRVIPVRAVNGISKTLPPSKSNTEFSIHVSGSYDYRFLSPKRDAIIHMIKQLYAVVNQKNCPIFGIPRKDLKEFTTTEKDFKKG